MLNISASVKSKVLQLLQSSFLLTLIAVICYLPLIANNLTNCWDGLWHSSYYLAGDWEVSCGRWGWFFWDRLRGGYSSVPFNPILTLFLMAISSVLLFSIWENKSNQIIHSLYIIISTTTCCYLSYRFQSPTFGVSFFLAVLSAYILIKGLFFTDKIIIALIISALLLCLSMGLYQTNLGTFSAIVLINMLLTLLTHRKKDVIIQIRNATIVGISSCLLYLILWELALKVRHISVSDYNGADSINLISIITNLPKGFIHSYFAYFIHHSFFDGFYVFFPLRLVIVLAIWILVMIKGIKKLHDDIPSLLLYLGLYLLLPLASNIYYLFTPGVYSTMTHMSGSMVIVIPSLLCLLGFYEDSAAKRTILIFLALLLLYGNIYAVGTDIDAMSQGTESTTSIIKNVNTTLIDMELYSPDNTYMYVGSPSKNPLFRANKLWSEASTYAQFGAMFEKYDCFRQSYEGLMDRMGLNLPIATDEQYLKVLSSPTFQDIPVYPEKGSITANGNLVIIKISDVN